MQLIKHTEKVEDYNMEYLIQEETLTAIADKIRQYTVIVGDGTHVIDPSYILSEDDQSLIAGAVIGYYYEDISNNGFVNMTVYGHPNEFHGGFCNYDYRLNGDGNLVPVIIAASGDPDVYYYVGMDEINGELYDKWRRIEEETEPGYNYSWNAEIENYAYTNRIVRGNVGYDTQICPVDFPAKIEEVFNSGLAAGGSTSESSEPILFGTYMLTDNVTLPTEAVGINLESNDVVTYMIYTYQGKASYNKTKVGRIDITQSNICIADTGREYETKYESGWAASEEGRSLSHTSDKFRILTFKSPVAVSREFYTAFMGIVDRDALWEPEMVGTTDFARSIAPIIIQGRSTPVMVSEYAQGTSVMYDIKNFQNIDTSINGTSYTYHYAHDLTFDFKQYGDECELTITNKSENRILVFVQVNANYIRAGQEQYEQWELEKNFKIFDIPKHDEYYAVFNTNHSVSASCPRPWSYTEQGLRYIVD